MTDFPFDIVGFDLDGTLLDTLGDLAAAVNHALALEGRTDIPVEQVRGLVGGGSRKMLARALEETGGAVAEARFEELSAALLDFYADNIAVHTQLYPGGAEMLDALASRGVRLALVTNKLVRLAVKLLAQLGLTDRFYTIIGGDTLGDGRAKPRPDLLLEMVTRGQGGRAAYVGDTTYDTRAAQAAGIPCVAVRFGFNDLPADQLGAAAVIDHFDQLVPALERL
ncbi:phosphoglycolate phosphatase [Novosphingobium chloroacetimidivorans]|uniref:Phosphoglycolate phosphatase n=1 Tax=Novosphingobium chloroacetimidivorans TaxID=1428314 RepID=A0A7W7NV55_9SPHN|nr:HAD-IA family hydrolase [Novosphingobium chloroacetimidivorans]MBB4856939.1 phosphoglycolate phosphatase [Novosphingobium chloroacetimidivorans]